ncbi:hypothetical protein Tco_0090678 [Tanacetum coccineum]
MFAAENKQEEKDSDDNEEIIKARYENGKPFYVPIFEKYLDCDNPIDRTPALKEKLNPFRKIYVWKKMVAILGSLPVSLQHNEWMPSYDDNYTRKVESDGTWHLKCSIVDPYGNENKKGYQTKATDRKLSKFYKLSDIMSPDCYKMLEVIFENPESTPFSIKPSHFVKPRKYAALLRKCDTRGNHDDEAGSSQPKRTREFKTVEEVMLPRVHHNFLLWEGCSRAAKTKYNTNLTRLLLKQIYSPSVFDWELLNTMGCGEEIEEMLEIKLVKMGGDQEIFIFEAWRRAFDINEPIYAELCHEFYSTYEFNELVQDDELWSSKLIKLRLARRDHSLTLLQFSMLLGFYFNKEVGEEGFETYFRGGLHSDEHFIAREYWLSISRKKDLHLSRKNEWAWQGAKERSVVVEYVRGEESRRVLNGLSAPTHCRALDRITLRELIRPNGKLITEATMPGAPRVAMLVPPRPSMQDLYDRMGNMEIR